MEMQPHVCLIAFLLLNMHDIYSLLILVGMLSDLCLVPPRSMSGNLTLFQSRS